MLFGTILRKYTKPTDRRILLREMILWLSIDDTQKNLFLESMEFLDSEAIDILYERISRFVATLDEEAALENRKQVNSTYSKIEQIENTERKKTQNSFNILLDGI